MENKIDTATKLGRIPENVRKEHKGFSEWKPGTTSRDHQPIVQILIDGRDLNALPTLVYMAREKRPHRHHNFKAGAMNSLIRVSSEISNGPIILNVDCDMYSNNSKSVRDALCFLMDEKKGHEIGYVQFPQKFNNLTKNDIYANSLRMFNEVHFHGLDSLGGPLYVGSGCFHRRWSLIGNRYKEVPEEDLKICKSNTVEESTFVLEEKAKVLATCTYEDNTQWGHEVGLKYGCPVEDVITGLTIQCRGWKSIYFNPARAGFLGVAPVTLEQTLVQHKRWSEGDCQIFFSKYCPFLYGYGTIQLGLQMGYSIYCLWALNSVPTLYYVIVPSLSMLNDTLLFPKVSSIWFIPFAYVIVAAFAYNIWECRRIGFTFKGWLNDKRMWLFKRQTSYLFALMDTLLKLLGINRSAFVVTAKVTDKDVASRYEKEVMEFGSSSLLFIILATLALLNLLCLVAGAKKLLMDARGFEEFFLQFLICSLLVIVNAPVYQGLFFRKDNARMPTLVTVISVILAMLTCFVTLL
ncbi:hypothetical protein Taro_042523 [Colocasia esculenta]|uniref:Cellulose synthase-like protein E6 n=1 Tax=Colocasia esculenta TaxID=4460 RepID=A0A843WYQ7_COLES|nr:hypothetical protein [Colocasia esculenta]